MVYQYYCHSDIFNNFQYNQFNHVFQIYQKFQSGKPSCRDFLFLDVFIFLVVIYEKFYHHDNTKFTNKWSKYTYIIVCKILKNYYG